MSKKPTNKLLSRHPNSTHQTFSMKTDDLFRHALDLLAAELHFTNRAEVIYEAVFRLAEVAFEPEKPLPSRIRVDQIRDAETLLQIEASQSLMHSASKQRP